MKLTDYEQAMLAGDMGEPRRIALQQQLQVGRFFDAEDFVEVDQAHIMGDTESLGEAGVAFLERLASFPENERQVMVPTITDPRGIDQCRYKLLKQREEWATLEQRAVDAMRKLGILMTDTCINYQTIQAPVFGQHLAFGDTGVVIYSNSVCGARSNFEGGPAALSAALTGRTPRYGYHLDRHRRGTHLFQIDFQPREPDRMGRARRPGRSLQRVLLDRAGADGPRWRGGFRCLEAFRRCDGELRFGAHVPYRRHYAGSERPAKGV